MDCIRKVCSGVHAIASKSGTVTIIASEYPDILRKAKLYAVCIVFYSMLYSLLFVPFEATAFVPFEATAMYGTIQSAAWSRTQALSYSCAKKFMLSDLIYWVHVKPAV